MGQPTHFLPKRQWGVFTITVPKDFGDQKADLDARRQRRDIHNPTEPEPEVGGSTLQGSLGREYASGREGRGQRCASPRATTRNRHIPQDVSVSNPLPLTLWVTDDQHPTRSIVRRRDSRRPRSLEPGTRTGSVTFESQAGCRQGGWQGHDDGNVRRTGRVRAPRAGQRLLGRGRRRESVLLDGL